MENYLLLTWLKNNTEADIEGSLTDVPQVEYQDYLSTKGNILKKDSKECKIYLIYLIYDLTHNPIYL
jgi:hypothetical protein